MKCQNCGEHKILQVSAKCSDMCNVVYPDNTESIDKSNGYVPDNIGIGGGDYVEFDYCANCGQIQGKFPIELEDNTPEE